MNFKTLTVALMGSLLLAACGTTKTIDVAPVEIPKLVAPTPAPLNMRDVSFRVLNKADLEAILTELETNPDPNFALYTLDNGNFQALTLNIIDIRRFVLEQQQVIQFYKKVEDETHPAPAAPEEKKNCFLGFCF